MTLIDKARWTRETTFWSWGDGGAMLDYDLTARGSLSLYEFVYRSIRDDVLTGVLAAHDRLPSKRALARHLGVSVVTVEGAYAQLVAEGYVASRPRSGYFVCELPGKGQVAASHVGPPAPSPADGDDQDPLLTAVALQDRPGVIDLSRPRQDAAVVARLWGRALRATLAQEADDELYGALPARGSLRLRRAIAAHLRGSRGIEASADEVVVGAGAQVLYNLVVQLLGRERAYAVEDPGYPRLAVIYRAAGAEACLVGLDAQGVRMDELASSGASTCHLMPSHQYPTGRVTSVARRYELLSWAAAEPGRYLVEDDYDCEHRLAGRPVPALASMDALGRVVYVSTFSRSISSALRIACVVLPGELSAQLAARLPFYSSTVSAVGQVTLARLLESGAYERHVARTRTQARHTRDLLVDALMATPVAGRLSVEEADSGLHLVLAVDSLRSEGELASSARERGLVLAPLSRFAELPEHATMPDGRARFVVHYDGLTDDEVGRAAEVLAQVV